MNFLVERKEKFNESASVMPDHALSPATLPRLLHPL